MYNPGQGIFIKRSIVLDYQISAQTMTFTDYVKETKAEMTHVTWPTRRQAIGYAIAVVVVSVGTALLLALADFIFSRLLTLIV